MHKVQKWIATISFIPLLRRKRTSLLDTTFRSSLPHDIRESRPNQTSVVGYCHCACRGLWPFFFLGKLFASTHSDPTDSRQRRKQYVRMWGKRAPKKRPERLWKQQSQFPAFDCTLRNVSFVFRESSGEQNSLWQPKKTKQNRGARGENVRLLSFVWQQWCRRPSLRAAIRGKIAKISALPVQAA